MVPLYVGNDRAKINPEAAAFSPYGAICKAAADSRSAIRASCSAGIAWRVAATSLV
jgi:hypothetical protein